VFTCSQCGASIPDAAASCPSCGWVPDRRDAEARAGDERRSGQMFAAMNDLHHGRRTKSYGTGSNWRAFGYFLLVVLVGGVVVWLIRR
jgi:hypothetical protein